jgi:hypothetical protein
MTAPLDLWKSAAQNRERLIFIDVEHSYTETARFLSISDALVRVFGRDDQRRNGVFWYIS